MESSLQRDSPSLGVPSIGIDTRFCENEPIHIPGAIQPHGALLAALADGLLVSHASANLLTILGRPAREVLGAKLQEVIGKPACAALLDLAPGRCIVSDQTHLLAGPHGDTLELRAHRSGRHICVDIEPANFQALHTQPIVMAQKVLTSFEHAAGALELCELAVNGLKSITGYDRVMAYRFGENGDGEVIAENREAHLEPFLGLRYPAADIPPQARRQYLRQRVGAIADASYVPVPLLADPMLDDGSPLDLALSALRSVSPIHREYMRNMKTAASLTIGLRSRRELWGMLVCHNASARVAGPELRAAAGTIGQVVSLLLEGLGEAEVLAHRVERDFRLRSLVHSLATSEPLPQALASAKADLLHLVDAGGAVLRFSGVHTFLGRTPPEPCAQLALATLLEQARGNVLALDDLSQRYPQFGECTTLGSGALLLPLAPGSADAILWFRPEISRTVTWGGNPAMHVSVDPVTARISPRASFEAWRQTVKGRCAPWSEVDLALALELRSAVQAELVQRTKAALMESEARLGFLAEHSGVVVALSDLNGVRSYVSPAAEHVLGWRPSDLVGRSVAEFVHPDDQHLLRDANKSLLGAGGRSSATYRFRRPDGSWLWVDDYARLRTEAQSEVPQESIVVLRDATERKTAEIKLLEAMDRMERMAQTDGLTGLANRRHLDVTADREWRRCARERLPLSVLLIDADRFKLYNDAYGHLAGDDCLRAIASQLAAGARRPGDFAGRYGGEEFVLLLPNTDRDGAMKVAQCVRQLVQGLGLVHEGNTGFGVATVSIGAATARPGDPQSEVDSVSILLAGADKALYQAKRGGRNQVVACAAGSTGDDG
jgi:diguanylate cyclase (GGDEF)-like protein/PAS domain S-box-containing protein